MSNSSGLCLNSVMCLLDKYKITSTGLSENKTKPAIPEK